MRWDKKYIYYQEQGYKAPSTYAFNLHPKSPRSGKELKKKKKELNFLGKNVFEEKNFFSILVH